MANSRTEQKAQTRARILKAANVLFKEHGFEDAKTTELANRVGISHGTIFAHFDSKASILRELVLKRMRVDVEGLNKSGLRGDTAVDKIKDLIRRLWYRAQSEVELISIYHSHSWNWKLEEEEEFQKLVKRTIGKARDVIEEGRQKGEVSSDIDIDVTLDLLLARYFDCMRRAQYEEDSSEEQQNKLSPHLLKLEETVDYLLPAKNVCSSKGSV